MARRFDHDAYLAELKEISTEDLCKRLEGEYDSAVGPYKAGPLAIEAARRLRMAHPPTAPAVDQEPA